MSSENKSLNILLTSRYFPLSQQTSVYGFLWPVAKGLVEAGHSLTVMTLQKGPEFIEKDGVKIYYINPHSNRRDDIKKEVRKKFKELHDKKPFHVVHSIDDTGLSIAKRRRLYKIKTVFDVRATQLAQLFSIQGMGREGLGSQIKTLFALLYKYVRTYFGKDRELLNSANAIFVSSPQERIALERYYFYPDSKIYSVPYGFKFDSKIDQNKILSLMEKHNLTSDNQCVVTLTDMTDIEDINCILKAFQKVAIKKPDSRLIIIGDGPLFKELEYEVLSLALGNKVILTGAMDDDDIKNYVSLSQVLISLSSKSSGFEPSLLLAMSQGKTIIGSEVSAISSIVEDGIDGFLVRPADILGISQLLLDILRGQLNTVEIGLKASQKAESLFDPHKLVLKTIESYKNIL